MNKLKKPSKSPKQPTLKFEKKAQAAGFDFVIGIDEAGRGPLAGPVVAAAVLLHTTRFSCLIADSKKITAQQREIAFEEIYENAHVGIGIISETVIDQCNILQSTFFAMNNAIGQLLNKFIISNPEMHQNKIHLLIDGNRFKTDFPYPYECLIKGDDRSLSIACASIVAKVMRDRILTMYDRIFPEYGFKQHKGYPTPEHRDAIVRYGPSMIHRHSFNSIF